MTRPIELTGDEIMALRLAVSCAVADFARFATITPGTHEAVSRLFVWLDSADGKLVAAVGAVDGRSPRARTRARGRLPLA
jgi:hypothetical protein